jgi:putative zinc finger protein
MPNGNIHLSDQELLLSADGELSRRRAAEVRAHLATCWDCRARMAEIEGTIVDFARAYRYVRNPKLPSVDGPRALLKAQLTELAAKSKVGSWRQFLLLGSSSRTAMYVGIALFLVAVVGKLSLQHFVGPPVNSTVVAIELRAVPDLNLTPGATRAVTINEICSMAHEEVVREVPASLREQILEEYRIKNVYAEDYEIDYLITPGLGGAEDIHNLWPEPKFLTWNAHVKDTLEEHLHEMVCAGKLDLSTAQRAIANDWIAAYKKYFQTDRPLSERSDLAATADKRYWCSDDFHGSYEQSLQLALLDLAPHGQSHSRLWSPQAKS